MAKMGRRVSFFSFLLAGAVGASEPLPLPALEAPQAGPPQAFTWVMVLPARDWGGGEWRTWVGSDLTSRKVGRSRRGTPGATVEVVERFFDERQERILDFKATWKPVLARSFQLGWQSSYTGEMLSEFMTMTAANLGPLSVPSVWYNGLIPYWVQQGWDSSMGSRVSITSTPSDRPMILYPKKR